MSTREALILAAAILSLAALTVFSFGLAVACVLPLTKPLAGFTAYVAGFTFGRMTMVVAGRLMDGDRDEQ